MFHLRASYPQRVADEQHWKAMVGRYWEEMSRRDPETLRQAFRTAWKAFPSFFPSLGELTAHTDRMAKHIASRRSLKQLPDETPNWEGGAEAARAIAADIAGKLSA